MLFHAADSILRLMKFYRFKYYGQNFMARYWDERRKNPADTTAFFDTQTSKHLIIFKTILINKVVYIEKMLKRKYDFKNIYSIKL